MAIEEDLIEVGAKLDYFKEEESLDQSNVVQSKCTKQFAVSKQMASKADSRGIKQNKMLLTSKKVSLKR